MPRLKPLKVSQQHSWTTITQQHRDINIIIIVVVIIIIINLSKHTLSILFPAVSRQTSNNLGCSDGATPGHAGSNNLAGRSTALAPPCLLLCLASVIVWTENSNFTIFDRWPLYLFYFNSETISAALAAFVLWERRLKK